ncbi:MAG: NAD(P)(+) transhydrogenase (Re/Si-specific) subunit alpha [Shinella sp.]|uniref:NAD(P)(+) transhydrogenase (Re/Si-specific) subunit alpha n=1 Tax=Shinella sp. TaxID=1870904 RepID=UPI00403669C6
MSRVSVAGEGRVAGSVDTVKKMKGLGLDVLVEAGAGLKSRILDADYEAVGARIVGPDEAKSADVVLKVRRPTSAEIATYKSGAIVMGAGVAGLQAIATARRLGAAVSATDVRPAAKEQVASLGAKFIAVEDDEFKAAETAGGYAKEMSKEYQAKQAALVAEHIAKQDMVITTALIPGRPAPRLVTRQMLAAMRNGSVVVDLAVERGGNIEGSEAGKVAEVEGVKVIGYLNVPGRIAASASALYAKNLLTFLETMVDKENKSVSVNVEDELVKATMLTHGGSVVHPNFGGAAVQLGEAK